VTSPAAPVNPLSLWIRRYANDRVAFVKEVLRVAVIEAWQEQVLKELDGGATRISIRSGHGVGKTTLLAWVALHFLLTRYPCKIAVTAPSSTQLFDALAAEVKLWLKRAESDAAGKPTILMGILEATADRVVMKASPEGCFLTYRTSRKDNPEALQGIHAEHVLLIADEASGVEESVFEAAAGSMSTKGAITILAGNPTRATGFFHRTHTKLRHIWKSIRVACMDSTRVDPAYIEEERAFGENSNRFRIRVLGEFPLGDDDTLDRRDLVESAVGRQIAQSKRHPSYWGVDVARFGNDASTLAKRRANVLLEKVKRWRGLDTMELCGRIVNEWNETPDSESRKQSLSTSSALAPASSTACGSFSFRQSASTFPRARASPLPRQCAFETSFGAWRAIGSAPASSVSRTTAKRSKSLLLSAWPTRQAARRRLKARTNCAAAAWEARTAQTPSV
jgi:phage terminase large subunit